MYQNQGSQQQLRSRKTERSSTPPHPSSPWTPQHYGSQSPQLSLNALGMDPALLQYYSSSDSHPRHHQGQHRRRKHRRVECATFESTKQEVCMYLDSVVHQPPMGTLAAATAFSQPGYISGSVMVDTAVYEAYRVLRSCWCFSGNPQDAFEPVRALTAMAVDLLLTFGRHRVTEDKQFVVLRGGEEQLPWVGCLLAILASYIESRCGGGATTSNNSNRTPEDSLFPVVGISEGRAATTAAVSGCGPPSPFRSWNFPVNMHGRRSSTSVHSSPSASDPAQASTQQQQQLTDTRPISRLLLLNCRGFGWLDSIGNEDYERSSRYLQQVDFALKAMLNDPTYSHVGRPSSSSTQATGGGGAAPWGHVPEAATTMLLSNAILMDGGVPSLSLFKQCRTLTAHHQYGRGLACLQPRHVAVSLGSASRTNTSAQPSRREQEEEGTPAPSVTPITANLLSTTATVEDVFLAGYGHDTKAAVCCGTRAVPGVAAQAVLLSPVGPLLLHVQFEKNVTTSLRSLRGSHSPTTHARGNEGQSGVVFGVKDVSSGSSASTFSTSPLEVNASMDGNEGGFQQDALQKSPQSPYSCLNQQQQVASGNDFNPTADVNLPSIFYTVANMAPSGTAAAGATTSTDASMHPTQGSDGSFSRYSAGRMAQRQPGNQPLRSGALGVGCENGPTVSPALLYEFVEWLVHLMRCPQPVIIVEWHLDPFDKGGCDSVPPMEHVVTKGNAWQPTYFGLRASPRSSTVMQLLEAYQDAIGGGSGGGGGALAMRVPGAYHHLPSHRAGCVSQADDEEDWKAIIGETIRSFTRAQGVACFDGRERPLVLTRGLEVVPETEQFVSEDSVITSLQYRVQQ